MKKINSGKVDKRFLVHTAHSDASLLHFSYILLRNVMLQL